MPYIEVDERERDYAPKGEYRAMSAERKVRVQLDRQPAHTRDGTHKQTFPEVEWPVVPRIGDSISFEKPRIEGVVHDVCWFSPFYVRVVVREE
jgi:hypothetical protein